MEAKRVIKKRTAYDMYIEDLQIRRLIRDRLGIKIPDPDDKEGRFDYFQDNNKPEARFAHLTI